LLSKSLKASEEKLDHEGHKVALGYLKAENACRSKLEKNFNSALMTKINKHVIVSKPTKTLLVAACEGK
jgi:hypothetical protein